MLLGLASARAVAGLLFHQLHAAVLGAAGFGGVVGQRLGLAAQMARWRDTAWLLGAALALAVVLLANGVVFAMLTDGRTINAGSALMAALGMHLITLALWFLSTLLPATGAGPLGRRSASLCATQEDGKRWKITGCLGGSKLLSLAWST